MSRTKLTGQDILKKVINGNADNLQTMESYPNRSNRRLQAATEVRSFTFLDDSGVEVNPVVVFVYRNYTDTAVLRVELDKPVTEHTIPMFQAGSRVFPKIGSTNIVYSCNTGTTRFWVEYYW